MNKKKQDGYKYGNFIVSDLVDQKEKMKPTGYIALDMNKTQIIS